jgi:hypothetical protein
VKAGVTLLFLLALPGCSLLSPKPADIVIKPEPVLVICGAVHNKPDALDLKDTPPTVALGPNRVWGYWFTPDLYAALAENLQAMRAYMTQQRAIRGTLVKCITDHNDKIKTE